MLTGAQPTDAMVRSEGVSSEGDDAEELSPEEQLETQLGVKLNDELRASIEDKNQWFIEKNYWQKSAIVFAGPLFNFILAILLVFFSVAMYGKEELSNLPEIEAIMKGSPAQNAGLEPGDIISSVDGNGIKTWDELSDFIFNSQGNALSLEAKRGSEVIKTKVTPQSQEIDSISGESKKSYFIGINRKRERVKATLSEAFKIGFQWTYDVSRLTLEGIGGMLTGSVSKNDIAGPVFIFQAAADKAEEGLESLLQFMALLSVSLAVLNLLPVPVLDLSLIHI